jgi:hypothetical protein
MRSNARILKWPAGVLIVRLRITKVAIVSSGMGIGAGVAIGLISITLIGGGVGFAAHRYREIQATNQPWAIDARNEDYFLKIQTNINKARHEDMQRCIELYEASARTDPNYEKRVSDCVVSNGWDNVNAQDSTHQYNEIMRTKIKAAWVGDQYWIDNKLKQYYSH